MTEQQAFPLSWPAGWPRTDRRDRQRARFSTRVQSGDWMISRPKTVAAALKSLDEQLERLSAESVVLSTNLRVKQDGLPYSGQRDPDDPGAAVYFIVDSKPIVLACDKWITVADNIYAIAMHIDAMRGQMRWGVGNLERAFTGYAALPAAGESDKPAWWQVLGLTYDLAGLTTNAAFNLINSQYRAKARDAHPDAGGSHELMSKLNVARDEGLKSIGIA